MKLFIALFFISTITINAKNVETVYNTDSKLNKLLKVEIASELNSKYSCVNDYGLKEVSTEVVVDVVDQGVRDYYYTTTFAVDYTRDYQPKMTTVVVKSAKYAGQNPSVKWTRIISIEGEVTCN